MTSTPVPLFKSPFDLFSGKFFSNIGEITRDQNDRHDTQHLAATNKDIRNCVAKATARVHLIEVKIKFENGMESAKLIDRGSEHKIRHVVLASRARADKKNEIIRLSYRLTRTYWNLKTITYRLNLNQRPVIEALASYRPKSYDVKDLGKALQRFHWGWRQAVTRWGQKGVPVKIKVETDVETELNSAGSPDALVPSSHFGLHDVKLAPLHYYKSPKVFPIRHIVQIVMAIAKSPDPSKRHLSINKFVTWNDSGRTCTAEMMKTLFQKLKLEFNMNITLRVGIAETDPTMEIGQEFARELGSIYVEALENLPNSVGTPSDAPVIVITVKREHRSPGRKLSISYNRKRAWAEVCVKLQGGDKATVEHIIKLKELVAKEER